MLRRILCLVFALLALSAIIAAQTSTLPCSANCSLAKSQPFSVAANWAPTSTEPDAADGFTLYQNGAKVSQKLASELVNGTISFPFPSGISTSGTYTFTIGAYNGGGENISDPIQVTIIKGKPAKPNSVRIQ